MGCGQTSLSPPMMVIEKAPSDDLVDSDDQSEKAE